MSGARKRKTARRQARKNGGIDRDALKALRQVFRSVNDPENMQHVRLNAIHDDVR
jgi:hypothetical protein